MKVARLYSFRDIRIEEEPIPEAGPGDALMRTRASGICSGDAMQWYIEKKAPLVLGHEPSGEIVKVGSEVTAFRPGQRVFVHHHAPCLACRRCKRGDHVQCQTWKTTSITPGGISEYILIPGINLRNDTLLLPPEVSFEDAVLIEPLGCVLKALRRAGWIGARASGGTALVIGLGVMGMLHVLALKSFGAKKVIGADMVPSRLNRALELGADEVIDVSKSPLAEALKELTGGEMADLVVVGPNSVEALSEGIACAGAGGTAVMFTPVKPGETLLLDPNGLYFRDVSIVSSYSCGPGDTRAALAMIREGEVSASKVVTHRFPIDKAAEAYRLTAEAGGSLKCVITFDEGSAV